MQPHKGYIRIIHVHVQHKVITVMQYPEVVRCPKVVRCPEVVRCPKVVRCPDFRGWKLRKHDTWGGRKWKVPFCSNVFISWNSE